MKFLYLAVLIAVCGYSGTSGFYIESTSDSVINELESSTNIEKTTEQIVTTATPYAASE